MPIVIWTDGRPHPKDLKPSYNGHMIGHWGGDTLHTDTVGIMASISPHPGNPRTPHSDKLHLEWTLRRVAPDVVHLHMTLHDDEAFIEPMTATEILHRKAGPNGQEVDDSSCFENNRNAVDNAGAAGFDKF